MQTISNAIKSSRCLLLLMYLLIATAVHSQTNISRVEYFFDTDPGFGLANNIAITSSNDISNQMYSVDISSVANGFHTFYMRSKDANGVWSVTTSKTIFRTSSGNSSNAKIASAEYFFDTDPGFGSANKITLTADNNISNAILAIDLTGIAAGFHNFYIRVQDENGAWSISNSKAIFKAGSNVTNPNIVAAEYFFDNNVAFGSGTPIPLTPATNLENQILNIDISPISVGFHTFFIRTKDANGAWSLTNSQAIFKTGSNTTAPNLVAAEYFFDTDPGFGNANILNFTPTTNLIDEVKTIDLTGVSNGFHSFNFRTKDANGAWSITNKQAFFKFGTAVAVNIVKAEFFVDIDPGFGKAINIPIAASTNITDYVTSVINPHTLNAGNHYFSFRTQDANGVWSITNHIAYTVYPNSQFQNLSIEGCGNVVFEFNTYNNSTTLVDTFRSVNFGYDSVVRTVNIIVYPIATTQQNIHLSGCNNVLYNATNYTASTFYIDTVKTIHGCDSVYKHINITVYQVATTTNTQTINACESIVHQGTTYTSSITLRDTTKTINNCDSIYNITYINVQHPTTQNITILGCGNAVYNGTTYSSSTLLYDTLNNVFGCDSVYKNVTITVIRPVTLNYTLNGCNSVGYNGNNYTNSIIVRDTIKSSLGCDSIYTVASINITQVIPSTQTLNIFGCNSLFYQNNTYTNSTTLNETIKSYQGCDSVFKITNINIIHQTTTTNTTNISGCNNVVFNSNNYTSSTVLRDTSKNISGCDSVYNIVNISITAVTAVSQTINLSGCDSVVNNSIKYTSSTVLNDTLHSYQGCDSVYRTINITVVAKPTINLVASVNPVCSTSPTILTASGGSNYTWSPSNALSNTTGESITASPANTTTYTVTSTNVCIVSKQITINVNALPNVNAGSNQSILLGSSTTLTATGALHYVWNTGNTADTTSSINVSPTANTNYVVTGSNANGCTAQALVTVTVNYSSVNISPNNYNYGNVVTNTTATQNITITNNGTLPVTLNSITAPSPYSGNIASQTINAGNSVAIPISFTPTSTLFYTRTLTINTSLGNFTVTLQGRGVNPSPAWVVSNSNNSFGNVQVGDSTTKTFIITNTGNTVINIGNLVSNNATYTATVSSNTIAVGTTATIFVKYKPITVATSNGIITINTLTSNLSALTINVTGSGYIENPPPTLVFSSVNPFNGSTGVYPTVGQAGDYTYRIVYKSGTNTAPQVGYPKVAIDINGDGDYIDANEGTFTMNKVNATSDWVNGEAFTYTTTLQIGNTYGYKFYANDALGNPANTININHNNGPVVTDQTLDLSIYASDISFSVAHPAVGQTFTVFATVHNNTPYSASAVNIKFYTDSVYYNQTTLPFIGANSTAIVSMNFVYNTEGFYPIKVWVDSSNNLGETNALNNYAIRPIIVGAFSIPGAILVSANAIPQNCPDGVVVSGYANYSGLNLAGTPPVLGALVTVYIDGIASGTTYTISGGYYSIFIGKPCGSHTYSVEVTDFTLTGNAATNNTSIACGVTCETNTGGGGSGNYDPLFNSISSTPCCLINGALFNYAITIVNNGTATSYRDTIKVFADGNLLYVHPLDSMQVNQSVNYNDAVTLTAGSHTLSYTHSYYNAINIRASKDGSNTVYVEKDSADLYLANFQQTNSTAFSVRNYNATCTQAAATKLYIYETDNNYNNAVLLDSIASQAVAAGKCINTSVPLNYNHTSWMPGYHYLTLKIDGANNVGETNENNNTLNVVIYVPQPDLYVGYINVSNSDVRSGDVVNFNTSIKNQGSVSSAFRVQFKVNNVNFGNKISIAGLGVNDSIVINSNNYTIPVGNCAIKITVVADVDDDINELIENNNADSILFGSDIITYTPAYALGSPQNPYTVFIGTNLNMATTIKNIGLRDVDTTKVNFTLGNTIVGTDNIVHITANGGNATAYTSHTFNTVGSYAIKVTPDYDDIYCEVEEENNTGYIYVNAIDAVADLRILSQHISPSNLNPIPGQMVTIVSSVQNIGNYASTPAMVRFWVNDVPLGNDVAIASILPGRDTTIAATVPYASNLVGLKIIKVRADINNDVVELDTTNNTATRAIIVGGAPDFARSIKQGITFNRNLFRVGKKITISNYIRNYGGDTGRATINFYYKTPTSKILINSIAFRLNDHDSAKLSTAWVVAEASGKIITEIVNASPQEFNTFNNIDSIDFVADTTTPYVTITPNLSNVCEGTAITFTATSQNVIAPKYIWKVNGVYTNDTAISIVKVLTTGDYVSCDLYDEEQFLKHSTNFTPTIRSKTYSLLNISRCTSQLPYIWGGQGYATAGTYTKNYINVAGCDSVATLILTVLQPTTSTTRDSIFSGNSYFFNGNNYTTAGTYTAHLTNAIGCDSTATLVLTVKPITNGAAINGTLKSCELNVTNRLYIAASGGVWSSSNTSVATISSNGTITPLSNGTTTITYTYIIGGVTYISSGVYVVAAIPTPNAIGGLTSVCVGSSITLSNTTPAGIWSSLNNRATINQTGVLTGTNVSGAAPAQIRYTVYNQNGCSSFATYSVAVNAIPATPNIVYAVGTVNPQTGGNGAYCRGRNFTLVGLPTGGVFTSINNTVATVTSNGNVSLVSTGTSGITYTFTNQNGCSSARTIIGNVVSCAARGTGLQSSVNSQQSTVDFVIYPNPAKTTVNLLVEKIVGSGTIVVTDLYGKQIKTQPLSMGNNVVNISTLSKGMYFISTITGDLKTTKKLVVE